MSLRLFSLSEFENALIDYEQCVADTPDILTFCSGGDWLLAAHKHLHPPRQPSIYGDGQHWFVSAMGRMSPFAHVLQPLEMGWCFGSPIIGADPYAAVQFLLETIGTLKAQWQMIILTGIQIKSKLFHEIKKQVRRYYSLDLYEGSQSMQSNIANGTDSFLKSRTAHFRSNLRRIVRFAAKQNFTYELITSSNNSAQVFQRMMSIERNSWKYLDGSSIFLIQKYKLFYANLLERLAQNNRLRLIFVRQDQRDCAYIFGGILHKTYKGFQLSYDDNFASFSLGHLSQWKMIEQLVSENIHIYDLGMPMDYKRPWSDYTINMLNITITHR